jgi:hypothetical protein
MELICLVLTGDACWSDKGWFLNKGNRRWPRLLLCDLF